MELHQVLPAKQMHVQIAVLANISMWITVLIFKNDGQIVKSAIVVNIVKRQAISMTSVVMDANQDNTVVNQVLSVKQMDVQIVPMVNIPLTLLPKIIQNVQIVQ